MKLACADVYFVARLKTRSSNNVLMYLSTVSSVTTRITASYLSLPLLLLDPHMSTSLTAGYVTVSTRRC
jgi:hypothetical protein